MADFLNEAKHAVTTNHFRLPLDDKGLLTCCQNVKSPWNDLTEAQVVDTIGSRFDTNQNVRRPVESHILGYPDFMSANGPFFAAGTLCGLFCGS